MESKEIATIKFSAVDSENESIAVVRKIDQNIALCLSAQHGGDVEVIINPHECQELIQALIRAVEDN